MPITILPQREELGAQLVRGIRQGIDPYLQQNLQIASQLKLNELMANLQRKQQFETARQMEPFYSQLLGPEMGAVASRLPDSDRSVFLKEQLRAPGRAEFGKILAGLSGQQPGIPSMEQSEAPIIGALPTVGTSPTTGIAQRPAQSSIIDAHKINWSAIPESQQAQLASLIQRHNYQQQKLAQTADIAEQNRQLKLLSISERASRTGDRKQTAILKRISPAISQANEKAARSFEAINTLLEAKRLNDSGELSGQTQVGLLNALGLNDYPALLNPESQEYEAQTASLVSSWSDMFPRGTQREFESFLKTQMPSLLMSQKGRNIIINKMLANHIANKHHADVWNDILDEYGEELPHNIESKVNRRLLESSRAIYKDFVGGRSPDISKYLKEFGREEDEAMQPSVAGATVPAGEPPASQGPLSTDTVQGINTLLDNAIAPSVLSQGAQPLQAQQQTLPPQTSALAPEWFGKEQYPEAVQAVELLNKDAAAMVARPAEAIAGLPGAAQWLGMNVPALASHGLQKIMPSSVSELLERLFGSSRLPYYSEWAEKHPYLTLPTSETLKEWDNIKAGTKLGQITSDMVGSLAGTYATSKLLGAPVAAALKGTALGQLLRTGAKETGFGPGVQTGVDLLGNFIGSFTPVRSQLPGMYNSAYKKAETTLAQIPTKTRGYVNFVKKTIDKLRGLKDKPTTETFKRLEEIIATTKSSVPGTFWTQQDKMVGNIIRDAPKNQKYIYKQLEDFIEKQLNAMASQSDAGKTGVEAYKTGRELYKAYASGTSLSEYFKNVSDKIKSTIKNPVALILGAFNLPTTTKTALVGSAVVGTGTMVLAANNAIRAFMSSPKVRALYGQAIKTMSANNLPGFVRSIEQLNKEF